MNMKILVCGGCGFIGSAFIRNHLTQKPQDKIINLDSLTIGSNKDNLKQVEKNENYSFVHDDIRNLDLVEKLTKDVDVIVNFAAESHVDRSISNPKPFIETNVIGIYNLLEGARKNEKLLFHVSTDEIYGEAKDQKSFTEEDALSPSNPYSATKAAADHLVNAYHRTFALNCITTRCTNNFGPYQFPEKLIPKTIIRALKDLKIPLYGDGNQIRSWIYVSDHVEAIEALIQKGKSGEVYNITAWNEVSNKSIVEKILKILEKSEDLIEYVGDRPGHDRRYSIDASKIQKITGWMPRYEFDKALEETVKWYKDNPQWWQPLADEKTLHPQPWTLDW
jgi:dTDP-glucose 4,6-dehydratase